MTNALLKHGPVVEAAIRNCFEMRISNRNTDNGLLNLTEVLASLTNQRVIPFPFGYAYEGGSTEKLVELQCKLRDEGKWEFNLLQGLKEGRYRVVGHDEHWETAEPTPAPQPDVSPDALTGGERDLVAWLRSMSHAQRGVIMHMALRLANGVPNAKAKALAEQEGGAD